MIRSKNFMLSLLAVLSLPVTPFAVAAPAQDPTSVLSAKSLSDHPGLRIGNYEGVREDWIAALENDPDSPLAYCAAVCIARMNGQIFETLLSSERMMALSEQVSDARAAKTLRSSALSAFHEKRFGDLDSVPPTDAFPDHVKHFAVLGALGPYDRIATLRHPAALDVQSLEPLPGTEIGQGNEWHAVDRPGLAWFIQPEDYIYPRGVGEGWVLALIKSQPGRSRVRVEAMGAFQAWWNGERALNEMRTSWADLGYEVDVDVEVRDGWNALLLRFVGGSTPDIGVQILDAESHAIAHESFDFKSIENDWSRLPKAALNEGAPLIKIPFEIDESLDLQDPWAAALATAMDGYGQRSDRALARALPADDDPAAAAFWRARHIAIREAVHLPSEVYRRLQLEAEAALARLDVQFPEIEQARIERGMDEELVTEAVRETRTLIEEFPECASLRYLEIAALDALDASGTMGHRVLEELVQDRGNDAWAWTRLANRALEAGDITSALAAQRCVIELDGERTETLRSLIERLSLGTPEQMAEAHALLERTIETTGHTAWLENVRLTLHENASRFDEIDAEYVARLEKAPWDFSRLNDVIQWRLSRVETASTAIEPLKRYIARHPRAEYMRDSLARLGMEDEAEEFFAAFAADREAALALRESAPSDASTAMLLDSGLVYFHSDGAAHSRFHQMEIALDRTGTEQLHEHGAESYTRIARVIKTDGQIFEPIEVEGTWVMPSLDGGDIVEFQWDGYSQGEENEAPQLAHFFASFLKPFMHARLAVYVPEGLPGEFKAFHLAQNNVSWERKAWKNGTVHVFTALDQARREPEAAMPSAQELLPWVLYGKHETEDNAMARWREELAQNSTIAADLEVELRAALDERIANPESSDIGKANAIWDLLYERILDWSGEGDTTDVWTLRRGNPLGLFGALLRLADVPFDWQVLNPVMRIELSPNPIDDFTTLDDWGVPMIRLRTGSESGQPVILNTINRGMTFGVLPELFYDAQAWVFPGDVKSEGDRALRTEPMPTWPGPMHWPDMNLTVQLEPNGDARVRGTMTSHTSESSGVREFFKQLEPNDRDQRTRNMLGSLIEGFDLETFDYPKLEQPGAPFLLEFEGVILGYASEKAGIRPRFMRFDLAEKLGGADRDWPLVFRVKSLSMERTRVTIELPEGTTYRYPPETTFVDRPGIHCGLEVLREGSKLTLTRIAEFTGAQLAPDESAEFLAEMKRLDDVLDTRIELDSTAGETSPQSPDEGSDEESGMEEPDSETEEG